MVRRRLLTRAIPAPRAKAGCSPTRPAQPVALPLLTWIRTLQPQAYRPAPAILNWTLIRSASRDNSNFTLRIQAGTRPPLSPATILSSIAILLPLRFRVQHSPIHGQP